MAARCRPASGCERPRSERALVLAAKSGGERERQQLIEASLPLIGGVARQYRRSGTIARAELIQEGVVGLLRALERYDPEQGVPFWAYARWWVRQAMQRLVAELSMPLVLSDRALRQLARVRLVKRGFEQRRGREPTSTELALAANLPRQQVESLIGAEQRPRALDEPTGGEADDRATVGDLLADPSGEEWDEGVSQELSALQLPRLLAQLTERERTVIRARYGLGTQEQTLREIGGRIGVSAERVRQVEQMSLQKLYAATQRTSAADVSPR